MAGLQAALDDPEIRQEAAGRTAELIESVTVVPDAGNPVVDVTAVTSKLIRFAQDEETLAARLAGVVLQRRLRGPHLPEQQKVEGVLSMDGPYRLFWRPQGGGPDRWSTLADVPAVKLFTGALTGADAPIADEVRVEATRPPSWSVVTSVAHIRDWTPPGRPQSLLASRLVVEDELADTSARFVAACTDAIHLGVRTGVLAIMQAAKLKGIIELAVSGVGPAGRGLDEAPSPAAFSKRRVRKPK